MELGTNASIHRNDLRENGGVNIQSTQIGKLYLVKRGEEKPSARLSDLVY